MLGIVIRLFPLWAVLLSGYAYVQPAFFVELKAAIVPLLTFVMLTMGLTLKMTDFLAAVQNKRAVSVGVLLQFTVMPLVAIVLSLALGFNPEQTVGMVLVGSVAGGTASNVICYLAKGDVALSITMTAMSTLLGVFLTPLLTGSLAGLSVEVPMMAMLSSLVKMVLLPVLGGVLINHFVAGFTRRLAPVLPLLSVVAIVIIIAIVVALNAESLTQIGPVIALAVILHNGIGLAAGYFSCRLLGFNETVCRTIAIEVGLQNSGLATALAMKFFSPVAAIPGTLFSIWHNISGSMLAAYWSKKAPAQSVDPLAS
ncbi:bile acid:sodium symporter family protein [Photobacterium sp. WH77]|uniref:bile acid:sodium symporter family protein n=1 Tax=Photobacterium TaxID=657 RepID=UPI001EDAF774|nr:MULTISPECIES: bile acid:sodium symporter family protein [Photobacterium]MCG2837592.1 bile acid:sodium symporter family protein [Photobacterium sp. WH77]MCG2845208.1 bile acid:sodium symporter family protein [Photobacterium sp. WH80]MDO6583277.1 bile acid:sodium symporter family protein [Photobacterium sp. 2_MG-2023]